MEDRKIYWSEDWKYAWRTFIVILIFQNVILFLTTGSFNLLNVVDTHPKSQAIQIALLVGMLKPLGITLAGFLLAKNLPKLRLRNAFIMGALLGTVWGFSGLIQIGIQYFSDPFLLEEVTPRGQLRLIFFLPQQAIREGLTGMIGAGIFVLYNKIRHSH